VHTRLVIRPLLGGAAEAACAGSESLALALKNAGEEHPVPRGIARSRQHSARVLVGRGSVQAPVECMVF